MKIHFRPQAQHEAGSVLAGVLVISFALGFVLAAYLSLVSAQHQSVIRSQVWNTCVPVMEAGVEEALAHLYQTKGTNLISNGWTATNSGCFKVRRYGDAGQ